MSWHSSVLAGVGATRALMASSRSSSRGVDRVVESLELSLDVLDASGKVRVVGEPVVAEGCLTLEIGDAVLGAGDPTVEFLGDRRRVGGPVVVGAVFR